MATYIGFLRAINLGAKRKFPKASIIKAVEAAGFTDVATYINTGNVRFDTTLRSRAKIEAALEKAFEAKAGLRGADHRVHPEGAARDRRGGRDFGHGGRHYVSLLKEAPTAAAIKKLDESITTDEVAKVGGRAVHLLLGGNYHEATLTNAAVEKHLGVATNRNLTVIRALAEKWADPPIATYRWGASGTSTRRVAHRHRRHLTLSGASSCLDDPSPHDPCRAPLDSTDCCTSPRAAPRRGGRRQPRCAGRRGVLTGAAALAAAGLAAPAFADDDDDVRPARAASVGTGSGSPCSAPPTCTATSSTGTTSRTRSTTTPPTTTSASPRSRRWSRPCARSSASAARCCCSTPATRSRAPRWPTTTRGSRRSPPAACTRWPRR